MSFTSSTRDSFNKVTLEKADFETWWNLNKDDVIRIAARYCTSRPRSFDSSDIAQEVALAAFLQHRQKPFGDQRHFSAWVKQRTHWTCLDKLRTLRPLVSLEESHLPVVDSSQLSTLIEKDLVALLSRLIRELPPEQEAVLRLRLAGHTDQEISVQLGKQAENVRSLARYGIHTLASRIHQLENENLPNS